MGKPNKYTPDHQGRDRMVNTLEKEESNCWQRMVAELKRVGIDIDQADRLNDAIVDWGERLAQLRELTGQVYTHKRHRLV